MIFDILYEFFTMTMDTPKMYGNFHLCALFLTLIVTVLLCHQSNRFSFEPWRVIFTTSLLVLCLEVYKQFVYSFTWNGTTLTFDYQWYAFPFQFCSTPMIIGLLTGIWRKGKIHDMLCSYLATYSLFAGICVMLYPSTVFIDLIGINIQTMVCHSSMIVIAIYLFYTGHIKLEIQTVFKALPVFLILVGCAVIMNEIAFYSGLLETETFNMFFISPHCSPELPVYSSIQNLVPYPISLLIYIFGFTIAASLILITLKIITQWMTQEDDLDLAEYEK
ncbi:MAG: YwaF family protein [Erysipelotrichaceae bacterium]|nr:YwaF family protein [Erysipelotrichaceae bacterium]